MHNRQLGVPSQKSLTANQEGQRCGRDEWLSDAVEELQPEDGGFPGTGGCQQLRTQGVR